MQTHLSVESGDQRPEITKPPELLITLLKPHSTRISSTAYSVGSHTSFGRTPVNS